MDVCFLYCLNIEILREKNFVFFNKPLFDISNKIYLYKIYLSGLGVILGSL